MAYLHLLLDVQEWQHLSWGLLELMRQPVSVQSEVDDPLHSLLSPHPPTPHHIPILERVIQSEGLPLKQVVPLHLAAPSRAGEFQYFFSIQSSLWFRD